MQTTKSGADRVESLPFTFEDDRTEMGGALDHMRKNGPGVLQDVEGMVIVDPGKPLMVPQSAPCDMYIRYVPRNIFLVMCPSTLCGLVAA